VVKCSVDAKRRSTKQIGAVAHGIIVPQNRSSAEASLMLNLPKVRNDRPPSFRPRDMIVATSEIGWYKQKEPRDHFCDQIEKQFQR